MELLGGEHLDVFYSPADAARAKRTMLEEIVRMLCRGHRDDRSVQHWIYTHPGHRRNERTAAWLALLGRFGGLADYHGYELAKAALWQRQLHLFGLPFYYISTASRARGCNCG